jgi:hypothetical protein
LPVSSGIYARSRLKGSPAHVSALSSPVARPASGPVIRGPSGRSPGPAAPLSCRLSAARHPLPGHPVLPGNSAPLTVGLPHRLRIPAPGMRTHSRVSTFRTHETRTGPGALCTPGTTVLTGHREVHDRRLPPLNGQSLPPRYHNPARDVRLTRHPRGFPGSRPSGPSPHLWPPWLGQRPLGFPVSFAPSRPGAGHARHGGDRPSTTRSYVPGISQTSSTSSLTTCDLVSQLPLRPRVPPDGFPPHPPSLSPLLAHPGDPRHSQSLVTEEQTPGAGTRRMVGLRPPSATLRAAHYSTGQQPCQRGISSATAPPARLLSALVGIFAEQRKQRLIVPSSSSCACAGAAFGQ